MDQDPITSAPTEATPEPGAEGSTLGRIVATVQIRVTIRDDVGGIGDDVYVPTNPEIEAIVESAFNDAGFRHVNATAEKV